MKNKQKGFIVPLLISIITILIIGGGSYIYFNKKAPVIYNVEQKNTLSVIATSTTSDSQKIDIVKASSSIENASGIIKTVYTKSGKNYVDIDYIEWNHDFVPDGLHGAAYSNVNKKIRTFEISPNVKFVSSTKHITFTDFFNLFNPPYTTYYDDGYNPSSSPWDIVITNGVITQISEHFVS